jgi:four helix bundle protein
MDDDRVRREPPDIVGRTFEFAVRIVKLCRYLDKKPGVPKNLIWQLASAGTSVGANVEEGQAAQSKPDFIHKYSIAQKESRESRYFLRVFIASGFLSQAQAGPLVTEAGEIMAILGKSVVTAKRNLELSQPDGRS